VHKLAEVHQLVHSYQTVSMVLMTETAADGQSPADADVADDVGWV
jgi:hypothetical protein